MKIKMTEEQLKYFRKMGKRGGKIGGKTAADNMTAEERSDRASKAGKASAAKKQKAKKAGKRSTDA